MNESERIGACLRSLAAQSLLRSDHAIELLVVPNGCTDDTAGKARAAGSVFDDMEAVSFRVEELAQGGKSRSWNTAVHQLSDPSNEFLIFLDGDIELAGDTVLEDLLETLKTTPSLEAVSGKPAKDTILRSSRSIYERLSLAASEETGYGNSINGSCYVARGSSLRQTWLPDSIPAEDGFLNALITTEGLTKPHAIENVWQARDPTHFYEAESFLGFLRHERRIIVGTMINRWLIEHIRELSLGEHAGSWIRERNEANPNWVDDLVSQRVSDENWVIASELIFFRLRKKIGQTKWDWASKLPLRILAFVASIPPILGANSVLKQRAASKHW